MASPGPFSLPSPMGSPEFGLGFLEGRCPSPTAHASSALRAGLDAQRGRPHLDARLSLADNTAAKVPRVALLLHLKRLPTRGEHLFSSPLLCLFDPSHLRPALLPVFVVLVNDPIALNPEDGSRITNDQIRAVLEREAGEPLSEAELEDTKNLAVAIGRAVPPLAAQR